jgi:hypothetical protein
MLHLFLGFRPRVSNQGKSNVHSLGLELAGRFAGAEAPLDYEPCHCLHPVTSIVAGMYKYSAVYYPRVGSAT